MLTKNQRDMIDEKKINGKDLDQKRKKYIDYTLKQFAKKQLDSISDLAEVLDVLSDDQLKKIVSSENAIETAKVLKKILNLLNLVPIEVDKNGKYNVVYKFRTDNFVTKCEVPYHQILITKIIFPATSEEIELSSAAPELRDALSELILHQHTIQECTVDEWNKKIVPKFLKISNERGQPIQLQVEIDEQSHVLETFETKS
jgi:hypothetical protein